MLEPSAEQRPRRAGVHPGATWAWARRLVQAVALIAVVVGPFLGGWQRLDRNRLANWDGLGWDLPDQIMRRLPIGDASMQAYEFNRLLGGGAAVDYLGVPVVDPVGGSLALAWTPSPSIAIMIAWLIPIGLGLLAGRIFCGWFCPFGTISRWLDAGLRHLAPWWPRFALPRKRWVRFVLLVAAIVVGAVGSQTLLYLLLPHALVQQATYGLWLMGGGGAALGALLGLLLVGLAFGPTAYCATVCPTGASLALLGHARVVHLTVVDDARCGKVCDLCDRACWLDLRPSAGDPGPDCDLCTRCTQMCPHDNLAVVVGRRPSPIKRGVHAIHAMHTVLALMLLLGLGAGCGPADPWREDPGLLLETKLEADGTELFISVVDFEGVRDDPDNPLTLKGCKVSLYLARGPRGQPDRFGKLPIRDIYLGPLEARVYDAAGAELAQLHFEQPNRPLSTGRRTIYGADMPQVLSPGARVEVAPIAGWTTQTSVATVPTPNLADGPWRLIGYVVGAFAFFAGLLCLSLAARGLSLAAPGLSLAARAGPDQASTSNT